MNNATGGALIVFGEALIDAFPEQRIVGGAPLNVARVTASLGCAPLLLTRIGADHDAQLVRAELQRFGMDQSGVQTDPMHATGQVRVEIGPTGHQFHILPNQAYDYINHDLAELAVTGYLQQAGSTRLTVFYFGTLAQRQSTSHKTLINLLTSHAGINYLDLNLRNGQYTENEIRTSLFHADILKVNEDELQTLLEAFHPEAGQLGMDLFNLEICTAFFDAMHHLLALFELSAMIVTLGAQGYMYLNAQGVRVNGWQAHPKPIQVVDTVGCGDAFSSVFLTGMLHDWPLAATLQRAHDFAGSVCTIRGAVSDDLNFYRNWQSRWN